VHFYSFLIDSLKEAGNSFQQFSKDKDEYYHCLTSEGDAIIMVSHNFPIMGKQVAIIYFI